ncbi:cytochrome o ubiquinol oxidase subunit III [Xanthomonas albilineans]|uniref:Cytochrome bo(3) ubiquinol oxidase subunit 3 n=1 Tax=Xanthomonas albilineans (strain GPE PC73 / CFBP 7063) TaxID=380358 RepID=D2UD15_XANAP|nr:cytochrome o ubiquinol oxidase subunit III [Xanthomonas albilineans]PPU92552.1 cytochrome o ubiquinol oxidase subunit III [Xanthomonas albilineans]QHQ27659.1 putative cytochrome o ubiquinol oxidase subunit III protein [Xanthomonas albilineans]CBA15448.1 probable cytochrome o ubiquinol oxidase subunit III protein [Xanthomonas albilineans GPE PC73]
MASTTLDHHADHADGHDHAHHDTGGSTVFGFWVYLMSDCLIFAGLFATYAVLAGATVDGPTAKELFDLKFVLVETFLLLFSSLGFGLAMIAAHRRSMGGLYAWLAVTAALGLGFLGMELYEFHHLIHEGAGPGRSAFLSAFFTLVGTHGLHVASGLLWMTVLVIQIARNGLTPRNSTRLACLSLFWHFLDVIWIGVFTIVYLLGAL